MKITILQRNIEWANPQANIARADEAISCLPDADLFVLPEMFSTGFCTQPEGIAESTDSETLHWMKRKAAERNCAIAGSVAVCENGTIIIVFTLSIRTEPCSIMIRNILFTFGGRTQAFHCRHRACGGELPWGTYSFWRYVMTSVSLFGHATWGITT